MIKTSNFMKNNFGRKQRVKEKVATTTTTKNYRDTLICHYHTIVDKQFSFCLIS